MVTIESSTLRSNVWETVYDELVAANLLSSTVSVKSAYPDSQPSFPLVVVHPTNIEKEDWTFDRSSSRNNIEVLIDVYTKKSKQIDQITDEIDALSSLKTISGLMLVGWSESLAISPGNENKIHLKTLTLGYARR